MNKAFVCAESIPMPDWAGPLKSYALKALERLGKDKWDLSIALCDDGAIAALNSAYRGKAEATDVLSFSLGEGEAFPEKIISGRSRRLPGDIVISLDSMRENARRFKISEDEELRRLVIHGILHLDGMDHATNNDTEPMLRLQEQILTDLTESHIIGGVP